MGTQLNKEQVTMELMDLPDDIFIILTEYCDLETLHVLYETCQKLRNIVTTIRHWNMSLNTMANAEILELNFFKDVSHRLCTLNMCSVHNLSNTDLISALKKLTVLRSLDVSFTDITICDLITIPEICPTLKDIAVNLQFSKPQLNYDEMVPYQNLFKQFENIHLFGSRYNLIMSNITGLLLKYSRLKSLKFSSFFVSMEDSFQNIDSVDFPDFPSFCNFSIYCSRPISTHEDIGINYRFPLEKCTVLKMLDFKEYEIVILDKTDYGEIIYATSLCSEFIYSHFNITVRKLKKTETISYDSIMMFWNKSKTDFDQNFYKKLANVIKNNVLFRFQMNSKYCVPKTYNRFYTESSDDDIEIENVINDCSTDKNIKRAPSTYPLDLNVIFNDRKCIELEIFFKSGLSRSVALSTDYDWFKRLTYLSLIQTIDKEIYSKHFFDVLFKSCYKLVTLNTEIINSARNSCVPSICNSLHLSHSLKNLRIVGFTIDFVALFNSCSQCRTLENIQITDINGLNINSMADPTVMIQYCDKLYFVLISALMTIRCKRRRLRALNVVKNELKKSHLNIYLRNFTELQIYHPAMDVFGMKYRRLPLT